MHSNSDHWVEFTGADDAVGRGYLDIVTDRAPDEVPIAVVGLYDEEYRRGQGGWQIARCTLQFLWPDKQVTADFEEPLGTDSPRWRRCHTGGMAPQAALPVIDLGSGQADREVGPNDVTVAEVADAAQEYGFFQVVGHGVPEDLINMVWDRTRAFFALPMATKRAVSRTRENPRGYFDRELTKNKRDLKEVIDIGQVPFPDLAADHPNNRHAVDGVNRWPDLDGFQATITRYLTACEQLAFHLLDVFALALDEEPDTLRQYYRSGHTSFLRLNYYPLTDPLSPDEAQQVTGLGDQALHHHSDAGALTVLAQDDVGGLQVLHGGTWIDVEPLPGGLVVNTGDIMQVWSNDRFRAALHRVAPVTSRTRYSLPYFFNPSYETTYEPLNGAISPGEGPRYRPINWGDFRHGRADGDFADYGPEVQISDYAVDAASAESHEGSTGSSSVL